ncbi:unnamed protein product [Blepharisma stoltei]|uniref:Ion transport domain-containing protein n=1 Tax=Blepharisma stoltei TaxID=1481888 RepID=A0AAU9KHF9_9CILI|nr:unnamed protein product [Blepharisma stoltei]
MEPNERLTPKPTLATRLTVNETSSCQNCVKSIYFSKFTQILYVFLIVLCLIMTVWIIIEYGHFEDPLWFVILEWIIAVAVILELVARLYIFGFAWFFKTWVNIIDLILTVASAVAIVITFYVDFERHDNLPGVAGNIILAVRNLVTLIRVIMFIKRLRTAGVKSVHIDSLQSGGSNSPLIAEKV